MVVGILMALESLSMLWFTKSRSLKTGTLKVLITSPLQSLKDIARVTRIMNIVQATGWPAIIVGSFKGGRNLIHFGLILYIFYIYIEL